MGIFDFFSKREKGDSLLKQNVSQKRDYFWRKFAELFKSKPQIDQEHLDRLEELLISSDISLSTASKILQAVEERAKETKASDVDALYSVFCEEIQKILDSIPDQSDDKGYAEDFGSPHVILVVGVNGVGKTSTIGKLASQLIAQNKRVILGAADTFRAAACEQLKHWGCKVGAEVVSQDHPASPSSVAYKTIQAGIACQADVVIIDTAGRLHNKVNLIQELEKIKRTIQKCIPNAPHEVLLVLDGTTGQNAYRQAEIFTNAVQTTGIVVTKLDSTSKGGIILGISDMFAIPIKYIGIGERPEDLVPFQPKLFIQNLFKKVDLENPNPSATSLQQ